jgi:predicted unusual protein kinase regulating ubiquinone biosynthesis (AarF/ABC1/UbiB family)
LQGFRRGAADSVADSVAVQPSDDEEVRGSPSYAAKGFSAARRTIQIYVFALTFALKYYWLGKKSTYRKMPGGMSKENVSAKKRVLAKWLREGLIRLGPTFIKIGQQFSTRVDVLSPEFIEELEQLQDNVCSFAQGMKLSTLPTSNVTIFL